MKKSDVRVCIVRAPGTNCDAETLDAVLAAGASQASEVIHFNRLHRDKKLEDYDALIFPGGFSYGDQIRSGVIWARKFTSLLGVELKQFVESEKPVLGICNGMQVVIESGLLPGLRGISDAPEACMASNASARYECRWIFLKKTGHSKAFTQHYADGEVVEMPVGHAEGKFSLEPGKEKQILRELDENKQIVFRYCKANGELARGSYPENPNASLDDVAGVCNPAGNVFALMPHPERAAFAWQSRDWTRTGLKGEGDGESDGLRVFKGLVEYCAKKF
ncbi:MAG: phosphoribosylformylglycinamidine synthase I [Candidatus Norongarragalinales archaeon]